MADLDGSYHHINPMTCPHCGAELDGTTVASESGGQRRPISEQTNDAKPDVGSYGVCVRCSGIQVYGEDDNGDGYLRKPTKREEEEAVQNPLLKQMQAAILAMKYRDNQPLEEDADADPDNVTDADFKLTFSIGEGGNVITRMKATIPKPICIELLQTLLEQMKADEQ